MDVPFTRLVRFKTSDGKVLYGEAGPDWQKDLHGQTVETFSGNGPWDEDFRLSGDKAVVSEVSVSHILLYCFRLSHIYIINIPANSWPSLI